MKRWGGRERRTGCGTDVEVDMLNSELISESMVVWEAQERVRLACSSRETAESTRGLAEMGIGVTHPRGPSHGSTTCQSTMGRSTSDYIPMSSTSRRTTSCELPNGLPRRAGRPDAVSDDDEW